MIISTILNSIYNVVTSLITIRVTPLQSLEAVITYFSVILNQGIQIFEFIFPPVARVILVVLVSGELIIEVYFFVMWLLKKIPMLSIN